MYITLPHLFIPTNAQSVQTFYCQFCPDKFRHICAIFRASCTKLYLKFSIKSQRIHISLWGTISVITALLKNFFNHVCFYYVSQCIAKKLKKKTNIKFLLNPSTWSRVVPCRQTKVRTDMTKLIAAFRNFANAPKNDVTDCQNILVQQ